MTRSPNVIPNGVRDHTIEAWITQGNLRALVILWELLRRAQDDPS
jgi:hypothetical protein